MNQTAEYGYDAVGNRIYVIDPSGNFIYSDYDNANRKIREYFAAGPQETPVLKQEVSYYKNGQVKDVSSYDYTGSLLSHSGYTYDSRGRIGTVTEKINSTQDAESSYEYSDIGDLARVTGDSGYHIVTEDAEGKRTGIRLSYHGKTEQITYPSGDYEEYVYYSIPMNERSAPGYYSPNGLLKAKAVWDGAAKRYTTYEYDEFGKLKKTIYPDDGYLEYEYTSRILGKFGWVKQITDHRNDNDRPGAGINTYDTYNFDYWYLSGKVKSCTDYAGYTVNYDYSFAYDQPTKIEVIAPNTISTIYSVKYDYDLAGRLEYVSEPLRGEDNGWVAKLAYDDNGNREQLKYYLDGTLNSDAVSIGYNYNRDNRLTGFIGL